MIYLYYDNHIEKLRYLIPLNKHDHLSAICLKPLEYSFNQSDFLSMIRCFSPLICTLWYVAERNWGTVRIGDYKRAFGYWRTLSKNVISKVDIDIMEREEKIRYHSDVCILDHLGVSDAESLLKRGYSFGVDSTITFLPEVNNWSIEQCQVRRLEKSLTGVRRIFQSEERKQEMATHVECTSDLGGVAGLVGDDIIDAHVILILIGKGEVLENVITRIMLDAQFERVGEKEFQRWLDYGFGFHL